MGSNFGEPGTRNEAQLLLLTHLPPPRMLNAPPYACLSVPLFFLVWFPLSNLGLQTPHKSMGFSYVTSSVKCTALYAY